MEIMKEEKGGDKEGDKKEVGKDDRGRWGVVKGEEEKEKMKRRKGGKGNKGKLE